jgi:hypothetical protein
MVIDGKGMLGHLQGLEMEIGRLVVYAVWVGPDDDSNFRIYSIYFIFWLDTGVCGQINK